MEPYLYSIVEKAKIKELLQAFHACLKLPIQVLDEQGTVLEACGERCDYCRHFVAKLKDPDICRGLHAKAGERAMNLGEAYIFSCHSNLSHIAFPLINQKKLFGSILVGPFLMDAPDSVMILDVGRRYPCLSTENLMELYDDASYIPQVEPATVTQLSHLLYFLFSNLVSDAKEQFIINQGKLLQQERISESIQMYKTLAPTLTQTYPFEKEQELLTMVKNGDVQHARALLNDLLGYVFFSAGSSMEVVKNRAIELCSLLSRAAIEKGAATDQILRINNQFLRDLQLHKTIEDLCYTLDDILKTFIDSMFPAISSKNSEVIRKAMKYISQHFPSNLSLEEVAEHVHLNPAYFSTLFKQSCGSSFKEYLTMVRIEECKRLLKNTDYSLINIAVSTGFEDQSYFSRVFKKYTGLTPKQYRG